MAVNGASIVRTSASQARIGEFRQSQRLPGNEGVDKAPAGLVAPPFPLPLLLRLPSSPPLLAPRSAKLLYLNHFDDKPGFGPPRRRLIGHALVRLGPKMSAEPAGRPGKGQMAGTRDRKRKNAEKSRQGKGAKEMMGQGGSGRVS